MLSRKKFLQNVIATATGTALMGFKSFATPNQDATGISFDFHCHPGRFYGRGMAGYENDDAFLKTVKEMNESHLSGAFFSLVADSLLLQPGPTGIKVLGTYKPGDGWKEYTRQMTQLKDIFKANKIRLATKSSDLVPYPQNNTVAAYVAVEGGDFLEGSTERLDQAYADGVRSVQLVHYAPNELGDLQTEISMHNGLSKFGKDVVRKMNKLGMVIDAAHASFKTAKDIADTSDAPILLSHSILEMEPDRPIAKRAISKEHAKVIAQTGGVIGAWPSGFNKSFDEYIDNIMRLVDVAGVDHVGLGTDMDSNFKPVLSSYTQLPQWMEALQKKGLSFQEVQKVAGGNAARLLGKVLKKS